MTIRTLSGLAVLTVVSVVLGTSQGAIANQAGFRRGSGRDNGSRATINSTFTGLSTNGGVIAAVRVQSGNTSSSGLYQAGYIAEGSNFDSDCGPRGTIGMFAERRAPGGTYLCNVYFAGYGGGYTFAVKYSNGGWRALVNGSSFDGPYSISFNRGYAYISSEYNGTPPTTYSATFGPSSGTAWQFTTDGGTSWSTVGSATAFRDDSSWSLSTSPWKVTR